MTINRSLSKFFSPQSVAVIGASASKGRPGNTVIRNLRENGYKGKIYPVNPKGGRIEGREVYRTIRDLPEALDLAVIILPAAETPKAV